jgi:heme/copper-type cytochrome/quinol oxidase subunit 2
MWAMIDLHDYLSFYLIIIINLIIVFFSYTFIENFFFDNKDINFKKSILNLYVSNKLYNFSHVPILEFIWTLFPGVILVLMAYPSLKLLYAIDVMVDPIVTVVIYGNQWYWTYEYADFNIISSLLSQLDDMNLINLVKKIKLSQKIFAYSYNKNFDFNELEQFLSLTNLNLQHGFYHFINIQKSVTTLFFEVFILNFKGLDKELIIFYLSKFLRRIEDFKISYDSVIIADENLPLGYPRLLAVDQVLILPVNTSVRLLITSNDVIHSWSLPSHGIKMDAVPGRINQVSFLSPFLGTSWGQCSELCGINHGFMPIEVRTLYVQDFFSFIKLNISEKYDKFTPIAFKYLISFKKYYYSLKESFIK